jgi:hypothetical protein
MSNWQTSSRCNADRPQCVQVARHPEGVQVRDNKRTDSPVLWFSREEWQAFIDGVKAGEFENAAPSGLLV